MAATLAFAAIEFRFGFWLIVVTTVVLMRILSDITPQLTETDLNAAWAYYVSHAKEIEAAIKANEIGQEDNATAQTVNSFQLPDEQLADLAKTRMPPQSWYDKDESFF